MKQFPGLLVLVGGALFVALHAVSGIGITGALGAKLASFGSQHDQGVAYTLYLMTFGLDRGHTRSAIYLTNPALPRSWLRLCSLVRGPKSRCPRALRPLDSS